MKGLERFTFEKVKREASAQRRPARIEQKNSFFPRNDRPYVLGCEALQKEKALERFNFEKAETQSNRECRPKRATHKGRPSPSRNGLFTRLETGDSFPHEREEKTPPSAGFPPLLPPGSSLPLALRPSLPDKAHPFRLYR